MEERSTSIVPIVEVTAMEAQTRAECDVQVATAKRYPRVLSESLARIEELATRDEATAQECWYALPRAGKVIEGPGIRMAEIVATSWKNLRVKARVIDIGQESLTCEAVCFDLENNYAVSVEVKRKITNRSGQRYNEDMIVTTGNAGCSVAMRNAIFKIVPKALIKDVMDKVKKVGMGKERTLVEHVKAMFAHFKKLGVSEAQIFTLLEVKDEKELTLDHISLLRGLSTAISEGTTSVGESFKKEDAALDKIKNKLKGDDKSNGTKGSGTKTSKAKQEDKAVKGAKGTAGKKEAPAKKEEIEEAEAPEPADEGPVVVEEEEEPLL